jgi:hypothetical protein
MVDNKLMGSAARFKAPSLVRGEAVELGTRTFQAGENQLFFQLGSDDGKADPFHVDLIRIICARR